MPSITTIKDKPPPLPPQKFPGQNTLPSQADYSGEAFIKNKIKII
jgi:hypothetical protein|tara:strand:+ start:155 stop:289 length:135 start_codon:yes stop_codon:yes gene_type:complete